MAEQPTLFAPAPFYGWLRDLPHGRWKRVAEGQSYKEAWAALLDIPRDRNRCEMIVLPDGQDPSKRGRP